MASRGRGGHPPDGDRPHPANLRDPDLAATSEYLRAERRRAATRAARLPVTDIQVGGFTDNLNSAVTDAMRYSITFTKPGVYPYACAIHPAMLGKIVVKA